MPPNILFLMTDEHRHDVLGYAGNRVVRTPTLDRLARDAVVFSAAYTPSPICIPGRQAMMAGKLAGTLGLLNYGGDLPPFSMTFAKRLSQWGYGAVCAGKLHHLGADQMQGWTSRIGADMRVERRFIDGRNEQADNYPYPTRHKWSDAKEILRAGIGRGPGTHEHDALALAGALHFIRECFAAPYYDRPGERPVMLKVSFNRPHYPYLTGEDKFVHYLNRVEPFAQRDVPDHPALCRHRVRVGVDVTERDVRRATAAYYGMIEEADDDFGSLLAALEQVGQDIDDWIVVFTADHGEMLGQHGLWEKTVFYEGSARVPLFVRWPGRLAPRTVTQNVSTVDLFATLCELTGVPAPDGLDSRSLVPLMRGQADSWRNEAISQIGGNLMIRRDDLKYMWFGPEAPEVLFDLGRDPGETFNAIGEPCHAPALAALRRRRDELSYGNSPPSGDGRACACDKPKK